MWRHKEVSLSRLDATYSTDFRLQSTDCSPLDARQKKYTLTSARHQDGHSRLLMDEQSTCLDHHQQEVPLEREMRKYTYKCYTRANGSFTCVP